MKLLIALIILSVLFIAKKRKDKDSEGRSQKELTSSTITTTPDPEWWDTGKTGERYTREVLMPLEGYKKFISNCYLPKADGTFTEVDVILLHESGVYVIESKNYSGWIFGEENQKQWTQTLPTGRGRSQKVSFFNPIIQNEVHLKWLRRFIDAKPDFPIYSYIVFSDRCELKKVTLTSEKHVVVNRRNLLRSIQKKAETAGHQLTPVELDDLYQKLYPLTQVSEEQKQLHIKTIQQKKEVVFSPGPSSNQPSVTETAKPELPIFTGEAAPPKLPDPPMVPAEQQCPRCGGRLLVRTAKRGDHAGEQFWGCSNYPRCRYTKKFTAVSDTPDSLCPQK